MNFNDNSAEVLYSKSTSLEHRKKFAQFFTPIPIAEFMSKWILGNKKVKSVLEPAFGLGIFSRTLLSTNKNLEIKGFEIDEKIFKEAKVIFENYNINIFLLDYMFNDWENKYDGIICNPPYFKFHDYDNKSIIKEIERKLKITLSGFTNLYTLFLLKSIYQLNPGGRVAYIVPSEFLNSDYGVLVKSFLLKSKTLRHIIVIDFEENVFDDALTTASILLCADDEQERNLKFSYVSSLKELKELEESILEYPLCETYDNVFPINTLNPEIKWRNYYQKQNAIDFKNLVSFSNFGKVVRGIATGSNDYFTFTKSKARKFKISEKYLLPCICKSTDVNHSFFTSSEFEILKFKDRPVFLFNALDSDDENVKMYIQKGEQEKINEKYLTANRNPWYALENRPPSPIWISVFNRGGLRFIRNEANVSNLTTFHCIYPVNQLFSSINIDLLFAYLLTDTARQIFEDNRREYGNGLQKFEPNDINKGKMLDLSLIDRQTETKILNLYQEYRNLLIENKGSYTLGKIDRIFIEKFALI